VADLQRFLPGKPKRNAGCDIEKPLGWGWHGVSCTSPGDDFRFGNHTSALRRIVFFERHGGELLKRTYLQPPLRGIVAVPMRLMFRPANGKGTPTPRIVEDLVRAIYLDKYEAINGIDRGILERLLMAS
jgi:hypothetical protein